MREDGITVIEGWHVAPGVADPKHEFREYTDADWLAWWVHLAEQQHHIDAGTVEPPDPDAEVFVGWTLRELAELSVTLGEGATLPS